MTPAPEKRRQNSGKADSGVVQGLQVSNVTAHGMECRFGFGAGGKELAKKPTGSLVGRKMLQVGIAIAFGIIQKLARAVA